MTESQMQQAAEAAAEPQVIRKTVWLPRKLIWADAPPPSISIPLISRDGGKTWQLDETAKDAEIARLRAELSEMKRADIAAAVSCENKEYWKARAEAAEKVVEDCAALLRRCMSDIFQTARVNQTNLNGVDPLFPYDRPCLESIGKHHVHQAGIDESMRLHKDIAAHLQALAALDAAKEAK